MKAQTSTAESQGLRVVAYAGMNKVLLAFSLAEGLVDEAANNLAGFTIWRKCPGQPEQLLANRISLPWEATGPTPQRWTPSDRAPFQKFRWLDVPPDGFEAAIAYRIRAQYFAAGHALRAGPEAIVSVEPARSRHSRFTPAFTRGYIASQAYADKFDNAEVRPPGKKTPDFSTGPFEAQYVWLGAEARKALFDFIADCDADKRCRVDVFAYDLDEPDVIAAMCRFGREARLRAILDNSAGHAKPDKQGALPVEVAAAAMVKQAAGAAGVKQGKFDRYQHNKVFIKRDAGGNAQRVIFGSMNFSVRGLYVQANNVIVVDDPKVAGMFAAAFDCAFAGDVRAAPFRANPISRGYIECSAADTSELPKFSLALSPHKDASVSLGPMTDRIRAATSSVLFAVMEPKGSGTVLTSLRAIAAEPFVFSYGTVETDKGLAVQKPSGAMGQITGFAALTKNVPAAFKRETTGGSGKHIHDKFVVVDFNGENPAVFTGSSNLAAGGEAENGDSLAMIEDESVACVYAIEAMALFDHFHFNEKRNKATRNDPLTLWAPGDPKRPLPWWKPSYDETAIAFRDRCLFAKIPLPADLPTVKTVDWGAVDKTAAPTKTAKKTAAKAAAKKKPIKAATKKTAVKKRPAKNPTARKKVVKAKPGATKKKKAARKPRR